MDVLQMTASEAKEFFLKESSYANFELPSYFRFEGLLGRVDGELSGKKLSDYTAQRIDNKGSKQKLKAKFFENVNYKFLNNKDGKYGWRPFQLIHPALYVSLVHIITDVDNWAKIVERFESLHSNPKIVCASMPKKAAKDASDNKAMIMTWWNEVEQRSLELSLYYDYVIHTDITNCYGNIYTHSIAWAMHGKEVAKNDYSHKLVGNRIDSELQAMSYGQTNGIPQGSVLMDFVAELVLGYADFCLSRNLANLRDEYTIIRYRDDYRIFTNSPMHGETIMKCLTEVLISLGLGLNSAKTVPSMDLVRSSIKPDKIYWNKQIKYRKSFQQHLLLINELSHAHPNSGSLFKAMKGFLKRISSFKKELNDASAMIGIVVNIAYRNPRVYPVATAIVSRLIYELDTDRKNSIVKAILNKFSRLPNTGHIQLWLQRILIKSDRTLQFTEPLCLKVNDPTQQIWNSDFLTGRLKTIIEDTNIIDEMTIDLLDEIISPSEVDNDGYIYLKDEFVIQADEIG